MSVESWEERLEGARQLVSDARTNLDRRKELLEARNVALDAIEEIQENNELRLEAFAICRDSWRGDLLALASTGSGGALYQQAFQKVAEAHDTVRTMTQSLFGPQSPQAAEAKVILGHIYADHGAALSLRDRGEGRRWQALGAAQLQQALKMFEKLGDTARVRGLRDQLFDLQRR